MLYDRVRLAGHIELAIQTRKFAVILVMTNPSSWHVVHCMAVTQIHQGHKIGNKFRVMAYTPGLCNW